jgi:hypothetical protein
MPLGLVPSGVGACPEPSLFGLVHSVQTLHLWSHSGQFHQVSHANMIRLASHMIQSLALFNAGPRKAPIGMQRLVAFAFVGVLFCVPFAYGDIVSVGGPDIGDTGIEGLAEGWSMSFSGDVSVTAYLANGSGGAPAIDNVAYITSGPLPNLSDIVASTDFTLPGLYFGTFTLFSNLNLNAGDYWLIFFSPGPPNSYANWIASNPATVTAAPGAEFLGYAESSNGDNTFSAPVDNAFAWNFAVTADTPEPSSLGTCLFILAAGCVACRFRRARRDRTHAALIRQAVSD